MYCLHDAPVQLFFGCQQSESEMMASLYTQWFMPVCAHAYVIFSEEE